ncbi:hypothetical protein G6F58_013576 [Rhizopus delemar]|nr:hypothetical protein G6F58_013576 [Rhizopus delemar]
MSVLSGHGGLAAAFAGGEGGLGLLVALLALAVAEEQGGQHAGDDKRGHTVVAVFQEAFHTDCHFSAGSSGRGAR